MGDQRGQPIAHPYSMSIGHVVRHKPYSFYLFLSYDDLSLAYLFSACLPRQPFVGDLRKGTPTYFLFPYFLIIARPLSGFSLGFLLQKEVE